MKVKLLLSQRCLIQVARMPSWEELSLIKEIVAGMDPPTGIATDNIGGSTYHTALSNFHTKAYLSKTIAQL
jgi:hypothetical protein